MICMVEIRLKIGKVAKRRVAKKYFQSIGLRSIGMSPLNDIPRKIFGNQFHANESFPQELHCMHFFTSLVFFIYFYLCFFAHLNSLSIDFNRFNPYTSNLKIYLSVIQKIVSSLIMLTNC